MQGDDPRKMSHHHIYYGDVHHHHGQKGHHGQKSHHEASEHHSGEEKHHDDSHESSEHHSGEEHHSEEEKADDHKDDVFYFAVGDDFGAYEFINDEGTLKGFHPDLIEALCAKLGYKCAWVMDKYSRCWETDGDYEYPGVGMNADWYTGCMGYWPYPRRLNAFNFTLSYTKVEPANVFWLESRNEDFQTDDLKGLNIGFIDGWSTSKHCLARETGSNIDDFTAHLFDNHHDMIAALHKGKIDLFLSAHHAFKVPDDLHQGDDFNCNHANRGAAFMLKYGHPAIDVINKGLEMMYNDGSYHKLCKEANEKYGDHGQIHCID
ncbi:unnamed protein product [Owenia fusiformis]|uniref:Solute-binding protein family 3/N-terminal domain-containing protein n=1 Tax=Owenia fusiformis TaxID=6347 RepID=A0A8S4NQ97_OWEFU|nr:unnamed protein product [Owenia fusiformis]